MEENRQPMLWGSEQDNDLRNFFQQLIHMRHANPVLIHGKRQTVHLDAASNTYAYVRFNGKDWMLVCFNLSETSQTFALKHAETGLEQTVTLAGWEGIAINQDGKTVATG
ncbi:MAG: DUF3459 domain-containing protein [Chloroflexi bacterium]|nr:DUF3459 domain-containing protein [Chloroflexota bacterium]